MTQSIPMPGTSLGRRALPFFWLCDCSGSMELDGKMSQLNFAVRETIPHMRKVAGEHPEAALMLRVMSFSTGASWLTQTPVQIEQFQWMDLKADGVTDMGAAFDLLSVEFQRTPTTQRGLPPVIVLITDGQATDDWPSSLNRLLSNPWGRKAVRVAIAIGKDCEMKVLQEFIANPEIKPLHVSNPEQLAKAIRWASVELVSHVSAPKSVPASSGSVSNVSLPADPNLIGGTDVW